MTRTEDDLRSLYTVDLVTKTDETIFIARLLDELDTHPRAGRLRARRSVIVGTCIAAAAAIALVVIPKLSANHSTFTPTTGTAPSPAELHFPLDDYMPSANQLDTLFAVELSLAQRCATSYGITVSFPTAFHQRDAFAVTYGSAIRPVTMTDAQQNGYHMPPSGTSQTDEAIAALPPAQQTTVEGCINAAAAQLMGGNANTTTGPGLLATDTNRVSELISQSVTTASKAPQLGDYKRTWARCMASAGYPGLRAPGDPIDTAYSTHPQERPVAASEITEATHDVDCKNSSGFTQEWSRLIQSAQQALIAEHAPELQAIHDRLMATIGRATVLAQH